MSKVKKKSKLISVLLAIFAASVAILAILLTAYGIKQSRQSKTTQEKPAESPVTTDAQDSVTAPEEIPASAEITEPELDPVEELISKMTLHEKVCQMIICTPEELTGLDPVTLAGETTKKCLEEYPVGGLVYFDKNLLDTAQTKEMLANTKAYSEEISGVPAFISVDEEGGIVARCAKNLATEAFSPMYRYRAQGTDVAYSNAKTIAEDISAIGFDLDFAPVADTWSNKANTVIGERAYSDDFSETAELVASAVKGFKDGGVMCTLKHFPGHGDTAEDSHDRTAICSKTLEQLENEEYLAFESGIAAGADMVMVGHITMSAIDGQPASLSPLMIEGELRGRLGFDGVVITDSLIMKAVADMYSQGELAVKCIQAGNDMLLIPGDVKTVTEAIEGAVNDGVISEERIDRSLRRILTLKLEGRGDE